MKLSRTNGRGLDHLQHLTQGQGLGSESDPDNDNDEIDDLTSASAPRALERAGVADHIQQQDPGDSSGEAIPVPIPNTEVKLSSAEDTERAAFRENRSSPGFCASGA